MAMETGSAFKVCKRCGGDPKPLDGFPKHPQMADGHLNVCKECKSTENEDRRKNKDPGQLALKVSAWLEANPDKHEKKCKGPCGLVKTLEQFHLHPSTKDGRHGKCKACQAADAAENRLIPENLERERDRAAAWRAANPEAWKNIRDRAYEKAKGSEAVVRSAKTRQARVKSSTVGPVVSLKAVLDRHGMVCSICTKVIEHVLQLTYDHVIPLARGGAHTEENLRPAHRMCNSWKNDRLPEELVGLTPPEPGQITEEDAYHVLKINAAKSASHKKRLETKRRQNAEGRREKV
jgi:5-methylcytosine-specific restriction endonuclease McrA